MKKSQTCSNHPRLALDVGQTRLAKHSRQRAADPPFGGALAKDVKAFRLVRRYFGDRGYVLLKYRTD
jgi:hypothetical protein